jgi:hypothetical protein
MTRFWLLLSIACIVAVQVYADHKTATANGTSMSHRAVAASNTAKRYHFLFVSFFGAGDFTPILNTMREAVRRGHRVSLLTDNVAANTTDLRGIEFYPHPDVFGPEEALAVMAELRSFTTASQQWEFVMGNLFRRWYMAQLPAFEELIDRFNASDSLPDVVVPHGACLAPLDVAMRLNMRAVTIWPQV